MASLTLTAPVVLAYGGQVTSKMCMQAQDAGTNALITLQPIDYSGNTPLQLFQFGNDGRIYLYNSQNPSAPAFCVTFQGPAEDGAPIALAKPDNSDQTQVWRWQNNLNLVNVGASSSTTFVIDDDHENTGKGNKIQLYGSNGTGAQLWITVLLVQAKVAQAPSASQAAA